MKAVSLKSTTALPLLWLAVSLGCGGNEDTRAGALAGEEAKGRAPSARLDENAAALAKAWEADANCKALSTCCGVMKGSQWEQTLTPFCAQVVKLQDFKAKAQSGVDPSLQTNDCKNRQKALAGMANASNPLPEGCVAR